VHGGWVDVFHKVFVTCFSALGPYSSPVLSPEFSQRRTFDVPKVGNGDDHFIIGVEIFGIEVFRSIHNLGASNVTVFFLDFQQFVLDDVHPHLTTGKHFLVPGNLFHQGLVLVAQFLHFQTGELAEAHFNDGPGLYVGKVEGHHEAFTGFIR